MLLEVRLLSCICKLYLVSHRTICNIFVHLQRVQLFWFHLRIYRRRMKETCSCPVLFFFLLLTQQQEMSTTSRAPAKKDPREMAMGIPTAAPILRIVRPVSMPEDNKQLKLLQVLKVLNSLVPRPLFNSQEENSYRLLKWCFMYRFKIPFAAIFMFL